MTNTFCLSDEMHRRLWRHLLIGDDEQVAFVFAEAIANEGISFRARDLYLVPSEELLVQRSFHVSLTDDALAQIIKLAWDKRLALVELHCHTDPTWPAQFSPSDLRGFTDFVPHIRWRLRGQPYLAIVAAPSDFDALLWQDESPEALDKLIVGGQPFEPTGLTLAALQRHKSGAYG
jgi:hypothetical protein